MVIFGILSPAIRMTLRFDDHYNLELLCLNIFSSLQKQIHRHILYFTVSKRRLLTIAEIDPFLSLLVLAHYVY